MANIITGFVNTLRNTVLNVSGVDRTLDQLLRDKDVSRARDLLQDRDVEVVEAIEEYRPEAHKVVTHRRDKPRKGKEPYRVERLPMPWQKVINEEAVFFLLKNPIRFNKTSDGGEDAFGEFTQLIEDIRFHSTMREAKRLAGSETESAILFHLYRNDQTFLPEVKTLVLAKSKGYTLRPLFDQFGNMLAFGYGYYLKDGSNTIEHFDVQTADTLYNCTKSRIGWQMDITTNPTGKINVIYCKQEKEWEGAQRRIERDEMIDSKNADTNNYFADPIAKGTADAIESLADPEAVGKLIQLDGADSQFGYVDIPDAPEMKKYEKEVLRDSILMSTFSADIFAYEKMAGLGTISGEALRRALLPSYIKRDMLMEVYEPLVDRAKNLMLAIMANVTHIHLRSQIEQLVIKCEFQEPFSEDQGTKWREIGDAYASGICSLETAVTRAGIAEDVQKEIERIKAEKAASTERDLFGNGVEA